MKKATKLNNKLMAIKFFFPRNEETNAIEQLIKWQFEIDEFLKDWYIEEKKDNTQLKLDFPTEYELYPFQKEGVKFIEKMNGRALIGDEAGLGKSCQSLTWLKIHPELRPAIIVSPATLKINWSREICKWDLNESYYIINGQNPISDIKENIIIVNYDILKYQYKELSKVNPMAIILDEIHKIANLKANRTKATRQLAKGCKHIIGLSGTPITKRPAQFYSILNLLRPDIFSSKWEFEKRYCLPGDAPILMTDLTEKRIDEIEIGDNIIGWKRGNVQRRLCEAKVLNILKKKSSLIKATLDDNKIIYCTADHEWFNGRSNSKQPTEEYSKLSLKKINSNKKKGINKIINIFDSISPKYINDSNYKLGYIHGFMRGDGWCSIEKIHKYNIFRNKTVKNMIKYSIGCACKDREVILRMQEFFMFFGYKISIYNRKDGLYELTMNRKSIYNFLQDPKSQLKKNVAWNAGYLGGIYDAEGSWNTISQYLDINKETCKMIENAFKILKISYRIQKNRQGYTMFGGRKSFFKFWEITSPAITRKLKSFLFTKGGKFITKISIVKKIEYPPEILDVYTLTTDTGNYIAYGLGSKNCDLKNNGFGWVAKGATNMDELHSILRETVMIRRLKKDVLKDLPDIQRSIIPIQIDRIEYNKKYAEFEEWLHGTYITKIKNQDGITIGEKEKPNSENPASRMVEMEKLKAATIDGKMNSCIDWISDFLETDEKLIVFCTHQKTVDTLYKKFNAVAVRLDGRTSLTARQIAVDLFQENDNIRLFIGNIKAAGEGITLTASSNVAFLELSFIPSEHDQAESRPHRIGQKNCVNAYYLIAENTIEEDICEILDRDRKVLDSILDGKEAESDDLLVELLKRLKDNVSK
jgi:SNF2 family DNA or RNA helicase